MAIRLQLLTTLLALFTTLGPLWGMSSWSQPCTRKFHVSGVFKFYILLLIPFTVAGIVLIFYSRNAVLYSVYWNNQWSCYNIVVIYQLTFFPSGDNTAAMHIPSTFIAWFNLDLEIHMCVCNDMTVYTSVFLQFNLPVYIWSLVGVLISVSR